ncbi:MAG TPA: DUF2911 domain-containing protein [Ginsengibacter sp.]|nr:DUF2911 domain-containing protein [Ginsengibacter sp.]HRP17215.1 DUF2911 domain-containing protein [Ginsengibacter sp.]HRP43125.1 DUF2911 domain-containing protein [Ginsengibacter sp.]
MKIITLTTICLLFTTQILSAQTAGVLPPVDQSPLDVAYYPSDYPILKIQNKAPVNPVMRVIYSRPHVNGRIIFGGLIDYGDVWRLGANEATEIEFFRDVRIGGKTVKKGRYTLYAIPVQDKWTFIVNRDTDVWGAFKYNASRDVVRVTVPVVKNEPVEDLTMVFTKTNTGADLNVYWDTFKASLPINF